MIYCIKNMETMTEHERKAFNQVMSNIVQPDFPCVFAQRVAANHSAFSLFIDNDDFSHYIKGLIEYTDFIKNTPPNERILNPLIVFIADKYSQTLEEQHEKSWRFIQCLIDENPDIAPSNYAHVDNPNWCLNFNGVQLFINVSTSKHKILKSRNLGYDICFTVNPREIFDIVAPYDRPKGLRIREIIRDRIVKFNNSPLPEELGFFGSDGNLEWRQYQLYEVGGKDNSKCPLSFNKENSNA